MLVEFTKVDMVEGQPKINRVWVNPTHVVSVVQDNLNYSRCICSSRQSKIS